MIDMDVVDARRLCKARGWVDAAEGMGAGSMLMRPPMGS